MERNRYIVLFFTQYGAISYSRKLKDAGIDNITRPVPRALSSSCGICVETETDQDLIQFLTEDVEKLCIEENGAYKVIYEEQ